MMALALILSFCSFGYQQLLALALYDGTGQFVAAQSAALAFFLLGLGLGSFHAERRAGTFKNLLNVEWALSMLGAFSVTYMNTAEAAIRMLNFSFAWGPFWLAAIPYIFLIGYLTGFELPTLIRLYPETSPGSLLSAHYAGALLAAFLVPIILFPKLDLARTAQLLGLINFIVATILFARQRSALGAVAHTGTALFLFFLLKNSGALSATHLKTVYFAPTFSTSASLFDTFDVFSALETPIRVRTKYQWIDILPPEFSERVQGRQDFQLYLDRRLQISSGAVDRYHQSFAHGAVNLLGRPPRNVLVLGGGDGLLAKELLTYADILSIDLVELDPEVIHIARTQLELKKLNQQALDHPKVQVHIGDAFQFVKGADKRYDLVLIDLPFPVNYELSLLFTREFYGLVKKSLTPKGLMILDFPLPNSNNGDLPVLVATLKAAGFAKPFAFGVEDFFVAARADDSPLKFDHLALFPRVRDQTLRNLISRQMDLLTAESENVPINSVLFPYRFKGAEKDYAKFSDTRPDHVIPHSENDNYLALFGDRFHYYWLKHVDRGPEGWPSQLKNYWRKNMSEPRDLSEAIAGANLWPRFQWGIESRGDGFRILYHWMDIKNPEKLREEWSRAFLVHDPSPWLGVTWSSDLRRIEFYLVRDEKIKVRTYTDGRFLSESELTELMTITPVGTWPPKLQNPAAAELQAQVQRNFLLYPRWLMNAKDGSWQRVYFP